MVVHLEASSLISVKTALQAFPPLFLCTDTRLHIRAIVFPSAGVRPNVLRCQWVRTPLSYRMVLLHGSISVPAACHIGRSPGTSKAGEGGYS